MPQLIDEYNEAIEMLKIERQCVARDCDHDCHECVLAQNQDELLHAYDTAIRLLTKDKPKPYESRRKLPCPKCGTQRPQTRFTGGMWEDEKVWIKCRECGLRVVSKNEIGAIRVWNALPRGEQR